MSIEAKEVKIAEQAIPVWKVWCGFKTPHQAIPILEVITQRAGGFESGHGYAAFLHKKGAELYRDTLLKEFSEAKYFRVNIRDMIIPKGSGYAVGRIQKGNLCAGRIAVRCERLERKP